MVKPFKVIEKFIDQQNRIADFVQNGPAEGLPGHVRNQYRKRCDQFANLPGWARALGNGSTGTMDRICTPYWNDQGTDGPVSTPFFSGGQCPSTYTVVFRRRVFSGGVWGWSNNFSRQGTGPVGVQGFAGPASCAGQNGSVPTAYNLTFNGVVSGPTPLVNQCSDTSPGFEIVSVTRIGGLPDNCGNPPPTLIPGPNPPPNPGPTPGPEPTDDPFGGPIPDLPIPPFDDPIFGPTPIEPGDDGPGGGGGGEPGPPAGGDGLPGEPDSVGDPVGSTGGDGAGEDFPFGTPPAGKIWVGALVEATVDPRYGNIPGTGPDNTVYPYVIGNASLIYATGRSSSSRMRSRWHEIFRPVTALEVTGAFVQCRPGVSATVRPVSATICPDNPCEE